MIRSGIAMRARMMTTATRVRRATIALIPAKMHPGRVLRALTRIETAARRAATSRAGLSVCFRDPWQLQSTCFRRFPVFSRAWHRRARRRSGSRSFPGLTTPKRQQFDPFPLFSGRGIDRCGGTSRARDAKIASGSAPRPIGFRSDDGMGRVSITRHDERNGEARARRATRVPGALPGASGQARGQ